MYKPKYKIGLADRGGFDSDEFSHLRNNLIQHEMNRKIVKQVLIIFPFVLILLYILSRLG
jgi:hypothetical protein